MPKKVWKSSCGRGHAGAAVLNPRGDGLRVKAERKPGAGAGAQTVNDDSLLGNPRFFGSERRSRRPQNSVTLPPFKTLDIMADGKVRTTRCTAPPTPLARFIVFVSVFTSEFRRRRFAIFAVCSCGPRFQLNFCDALSLANPIRRASLPLCVLPMPSPHSLHRAFSFWLFCVFLPSHVCGRLRPNPARRLSI
jgi:hypothetical protein